MYLDSLCIPAEHKHLDADIMKITARSKAGLASFTVGVLMGAVSYYWNKATEASNLKTGSDDVNIFAGFVLLFGIIFILFGVVLMIVSYLASAIRKR